MPKAKQSSPTRSAIITLSPNDVQAGPEGSFLDRANYIPGYLVRLANAMSRGGSRVYLKLFGVGVNEWRMLSMLAIDPGLVAYQICDALELDKSAASRSMRSLTATGLIRQKATSNNQRSRHLYLTAKGRELHGRILALALERERYLLADVTPEERQILLELLRKLTANLSSLGAYEDQLIGGEVDAPPARITESS